MKEILTILAPEILLVAVACFLFLLGCSTRRGARAAAPWVALLALLGAMVIWFWQYTNQDWPPALNASVRLDSFFPFYIRLLTLGIAIILLLLAWPTRADRTGNSALDYGLDGGEFFGLFLLSVAGLLMVTVANDLIILFLALELVSIPTYVMVTISRPSDVAREAGVKYFFLGAMSVAILLMGFSYLYGTTGSVNMSEIGAFLRSGLDADAIVPLSVWHKLAFILILIGLAYKMAAFPLQFYAGDVYEGAATPVTAFLAFVPKTAGFVALIKVLMAVGGPGFRIPADLVWLLWIVAAVTMTVGNVLGLLQSNVKRVLAYSSIAHSGYMLVGVTALALNPERALGAVLFYLAAYGMMNAGAFGVLMLLPSADGRGSAETFDDLAGQGRRYVAAGLAMAVCCFSLIGIPLTVGFVGKLLLIMPALRSIQTAGWPEGSMLHAGMIWLVIILVVNAAISAAYYLRMVGTMFLRPAMGAAGEEGRADRRQAPVALAVVLSVTTTLAFGMIPPAAQGLIDSAALGAQIKPAVQGAPAQ